MVTRLRPPPQLREPTLVLACLAAFSCANNPWVAQREYLKAITPKPLEQSTAAPAVAALARKLKVRVWADSDYRGQTLRWQERIRESWARASDFTRGPFGVEFELVAVTEWDHRAPMGTTLEPVLDELERQDAGDDVDLVVAYVSALTAFTSSYHQLGIARRPGHHLVLRGIDNAEETDIVEQSVRQLGDDEKRPVLRARKQHKETSVVLHEWAHALGSFHDRDTDKLMSPSYSPSHEKFSPTSEAMIRIGLKHHPLGLKDTAERTAWLAEVKALLDPIPENAWARGEHEQYVAWMERKPARTTLAGPDLTLLNMAIDKLNAGQNSDALVAVRPLAARYPHDERVLGVQCSAAERAHAPDADDLCTAACEGAGSIFACLNVADAALIAGKEALVREQLRALEPKVKDRQTWTQLAGLYRRAQCPTWAEQAAAHAEMTEAASQICRVGLAHQTLVRPRRRQRRRRRSRALAVPPAGKAARCTRPAACCFRHR